MQHNLVIALDVAALGQLAVGKDLATTAVRQLVLNRTGKEIAEVEQLRWRIISTRNLQIQQIGLQENLEILI
jgi:hypothetical protein